MKTWKIYSTKAIISEHHRAAPEGKWIPGRGINWQKLFEPKIHLNVLARKYKTFNVNHFPLLWLFLLSNRVMAKWAYLRGREWELGLIFGGPHTSRRLISGEVRYFNSDVLYMCTWFVLDDLLQSICFRVLCSKHSIIFETTYLPKLLISLCWHILHQM